MREEATLVDLIIGKVAQKCKKVNLSSYQTITFKFRIAMIEIC